MAPAAIIDQKTSKIPNWLTFPFIAVGLILTGIFNIAFLPQCLLTIIGLFLFGMLGLIGLGDIKLLMVVASTCGALYTILVLVFASIILFIKELLFDFRNTVNMALQGLRSILVFHSPKIDNDGKKVPFAIYMFAGYVAVCIGRGVLYVVKTLQ